MKTEKKVTVTEIVGKLDKLAVERERYEANELLRSNKRLYELLGGVLELYYTASTSEKLLKDTIETVRARLTERNIRTQKNSPALTLFVRYTFNADRQRALNYSRSLLAAVQAKIQPAQFADFVAEKGGVEECKRQVAINPQVLQQRLNVTNAMTDVEIDLELRKASPLATFIVDASVVAEHCDKGLMVVLADVGADGSVNALCVVPSYSAGVEKWAKTELAKKLAAHTQVVLHADKDAAAQQAIDAAAAAAQPHSVNDNEHLPLAA
jgi:hypothetical protein